MLLGTNHHYPSVRHVADQLDNVPLGTDWSNMPCVYTNCSLPVKRVTCFDVVKCLIIDPTKNPKWIFLYRVKPAAAMMSLTEDDSVVDLMVEEGDNDNYNGQVTAFFDASGHYLGYYAWSSYKPEGDSEARFQNEMDNFAKTGMDKECKIEKTSREMSGDEMRRIFQLPLSKHLAP
jgi:hypothetical protein